MLFGYTIFVKDNFTITLLEIPKFRNRLESIFKCALNHRKFFFTANIPLTQNSFSLPHSIFNNSFSNLHIHFSPHFILIFLIQFIIHRYVQFNEICVNRRLHESRNINSIKGINKKICTFTVSDDCSLC